MESMSIVKKALIVVTVLIYIVHLVLNALSAQGGPDNKLFPNTVGNVSRTFEIDITPVSSTFAIWSAIFILQILWMIYALVTVFRSTPTSNILSAGFFISFNMNIFFITAWLFVWARKEAVASFVVIVLGQISFDVAVGLAFYSLKKFLDDRPEFKEKNIDVWFNRIVVQNALLFYGTWTTIATFLNFTIVLTYYMDLSSRTASIISLVLLGLVLLTWFILENVVLLNAVQYTFTVYIVLMIGLGGVFSNGIFDTDKVLGGLTLALLILSVVFFLVRCIIIIGRHKNKSFWSCGRKESEIV